MSAKKKYEYREKKNFSRDSDGLKQRRLKQESRWRFNSNQSFETETNEDDDWLEESDYQRP